MVAQANRTLAPLTAVMLELDHFKHINDQFGHGKGDEVLAAVGAALTSCLRASDFAGRFGGEEFLVLLDRIDNYAISFVMLAVFWLGHLRLMRRLHETDAVFVALNLAFLLFTTLVPPLTDLLGDHPELPRAAVLYGGDLVLIIACEAAMWRRVCTRLANDTLADPQATWRTVSHRYAVALGIVLAGIGAALVEIAIGRSADVAPWVYLLLLAAGVMRPALRTARRS